MSNYNYTVGELNSQIKKEAKMDIAQLGNPSDQNTFIWYYMTGALWKYAGILYKKKTSDPLVVAADGYVTFKYQTVDIDDMYAPIRILVGSESGKALLKRSSFDSSTGWIKESANDLIHIKGAGTYVLQYHAYPAKITADTQALDIPSAAYDLIKFETIGRIKESLNDTDGAALAFNSAKTLIPVVIKANLDSSMATTGGIIPSLSDSQYY